MWKLNQTSQTWSSPTLENSGVADGCQGDQESVPVVAEEGGSEAKKYGDEGVVDEKPEGGGTSEDEREAERPGGDVPKAVDGGG